VSVVVVRDAIAILEGAHKRIEKGWTGLALARDENDVACDPTSDKAVCWCVSGAMLASMDVPRDLLGRVIDGSATDKDRKALGDAFDLARRTLQAANGGYALVYWNDNIATKKGRVEGKSLVLNKLAHAISVLKAGAT